MQKTLVLSFLFVGLLIAGCNTSKTATDTNTTAPTNRPDRQNGPPSVEQLLEMDKDGDGRLSKEEVTGPLQKDFSKIDTDSNGYLSKTELENMPKPQRGGRGPRGGGQ